MMIKLNIIWIIKFYKALSILLSSIDGFVGVIKNFDNY